MNSRNKVGALIDRRFGENDPTMTPEERAAERFARESQKKMRKESMFNLEEDEEEFQLTHMGQSLTLDGTTVDDFDGGDLEGAESDEEASRKRKRFGEDDEDAEDFIDFGEDGEALPERKKSKAEVMKEVIAKSKFHKAERQKAKEDDDDLRDELDQELPDLFEALRGMKAPAKPEPPKQDLDTMNPERAAMLREPEGKDTEKEYDQRLKQLTFDKRSKPTDRTKTEEEKAEEEAKRLKKLEEDRLRRMRGEQVSDEEEEESDKDSFFQGDEDEESEVDDAAAFGLHTTSYEPRPELAVEDEDDFIIDDDLVETRSNVSLSLDGSDIEEELSDEDDVEESEEEDELINGMTLPAASSTAASTAVQVNQTADGKLAFTYPCPGNHEEFLEITKDVPTQDLPTVIQRIRALHHPRLHADNKAKLGRFAEILVDHVSYMANESDKPSFAIIENILRHVHSMAKTHPINVAMAFRARLREISEDRPLNLLPGDLIVLTGIATVFPTSDHFHAVTTPAHLCLARFLGQCSLNSTSDFVTGAFAASLCLQYQAISKRYMPEFINYTLNALCNLAPTEPSAKNMSFPHRKSQQSVQLAPSKKVTPRKLQFQDVKATPSDSQAEEDLKISLVTTFVSLLDTASDLWAEKSAFIEIFTPVRAVLNHLRQCFKSKVFAATRDALQSTLDKVDAHITRARLARRPLLLHNHRPLAIKSAIPKFEENFNPDKHYDPDRERAEANRLKAEYKREKKGAMRELRKDASFIAREKLREKKERDAEYEKKYKRLIAEIQSEEGRAANEYEREKRGRQGKR